MANYNNCQALSSDQMFGRDEGNTPGKLDSINYHEWEGKIKNAKEVLLHKSTKIYNKLKNKWSEYT